MKMIKFDIKYIDIILLLVILSSCSKSFDNPIQMDKSKTKDEYINLSPPHFNIGTSSINIFDVYFLEILPDVVGAQIMSLRYSSIGESYLVNGFSFFRTQPCIDCLKIDSLGLDEQENIVIRFSIKHPYNKGDPFEPPSTNNRLDLDVFDIAMLIRPINGHPLFFPQMNVNLYGGYVENADGYTSELSLLLDDNSILPYKICYESQNNNRFEMGLDYQPFDVIFNKHDTTVYELYLTFAYGVSAKYSSRLDPAYYIPEFNRKAPWKVDILTNTIYDNNDIYLFVHVYDWNHGVNVSDNYPEPDRRNLLSAPSDVISVTLEIPELLDDIINMDLIQGSTNGWDHPLIFGTTLSQFNNVPNNKYPGIVKVIDSRDPGIASNGGETDTLLSIPDGLNKYWNNISEFCTYQYFTQDFITECMGEPTSPEIVSWYYPLGYYYDLDFKDDFAFSKTSFFKSFDISDPENPKLLSHTDLLWSNHHKIALLNNYAYLTQDHSGFVGIKIVDISNPSNMEIVGGFSADPMGNTFPVDEIIVNNFLYVRNGPYHRLSIFRITNPLNPAFCNVMDLSQYRKPGRYIAYDNNKLFLYGDNDSLTILNILNPVNPIVLSNSENIKARDLAIKDDILYSVCSDLDIIDIRNPATPIIINSLQFTQALKIKIFDDYLYILDFKDGLKIFQISDPLNPVLISEFTSEDLEFFDLEIYHNTAYINIRNSNHHRCARIDVSDPYNPRVISLGDIFGDPESLKVNGNYAYVAQSHFGLAAIDITDKLEPKYIDGFNTYDGQNVDLKDKYILLADRNEGLKVFEFINYSNLHYVNRINFRSVLDVAIKNDYAFATFELGLLSFDARNPAQLSLLSSWPRDELTKIVLHDDYGYAIGKGIDIFNLSNPHAIGLAGTLDDNLYLDDIEIRNNNLFAVSEQRGFEIYDVSNHNNIFLKSSLPGLRLSKVELNNNYAYAVSPDNELIIYDISDPSSPFIFSRLPILRIQDIVIQCNYAYVLQAHLDGFIIIKLWD